MDELPDNSVHLMVTSPPYNVQKEYDDDLTLEEYEALLHTVFTETHRVLSNGGRACINIANLGRKPYLPINALVTDIMLEIGFYMRGEIIWDKGSSAGSSTAWGSWMSAGNPVLRDVHEYILVFSKGSFSRSSHDQISTIERDEFLEWTKSVWTFPTVSAKKIGHPAPFPLELPLRLISLYSFQGDIILDPFCGSGTTCQAAKQLNRRYLGYEVNPEYVKLAEERLAKSPDPPDLDDPNIEAG
jgi:site-specific DNA-methyltransferase (adenine-specific)